MSKEPRKNIKVKHENLYFTFTHQNKIKKFVFYFENADGYQCNWIFVFDEYVRMF